MLTREETEARVGFPIPQKWWDFVPWGNRLLVRRTPKEKMTEGGLFIPNTSQRQQGCGTIVKVGHTVGSVLEPFQTPGQVVVHDDLTDGMGGFSHDDLIGLVITFGMFTGHGLDVDSYEDTEWILLAAADILGHNNE